jgi:hypothetical protein
MCSELLIKLISTNIKPSRARYSQTLINVHILLVRFDMALAKFFRYITLHYCIHLKYCGIVVLWCPIYVCVYTYIRHVDCGAKRNIHCRQL